MIQANKSTFVSQSKQNFDKKKQSILTNDYQVSEEEEDVFDRPTISTLP